MNLDDLQIPPNCPFFDFKWPYDDKKGRLCFAVAEALWTPLKQLKGAPWIIACAVAVLYWQIQVDLIFKTEILYYGPCGTLEVSFENPKLHNLIHGSELNQECAKITEPYYKALKQVKLWKEAAFNV